MRGIFKKELILYFGSPIAYVVIGIFLLATMLLLWVFPGYQNVLDTEFAQLDGLFTNAPWLFLWLIPALCMHLFSEMYRSRKSVLVLTRPISFWKLIMGKYLASLLVVLLAILPTFISLYSIYRLASPMGNIDIGSEIGSYIGLILLAISYLSISLFSSAITNNQLIAFLSGAILCVFWYVGWEYLASIIPQHNIQNLLLSFSIKEHYLSLSRGVIDSRDVIYFLLLGCFFLFLTHYVVSRKR